METWLKVSRAVTGACVELKMRARMGILRQSRDLQEGVRAWGEAGRAQAGDFCCIWSVVAVMELMG